MRSKILMLGLALPFLSGAAIYPPMIGGDFEFHFQPANEYDADGIPLHPLTLSIGIASDTGGAVIACTDTPEQNKDYRVTVSIATTGVRQSFKAYGYTEPGCQGVVSVGSENTGYTYPGMSPYRPDLVQ